MPKLIVHDLLELGPKALDFIIRAGISDAAQRAAIKLLVAGLKSAGLWSKLIAFYPIVGGTAERHRHNLISASYKITWAGGLTHDASGVKSNGSTGYGLCVNLRPLTFAERLKSGISVYLREAANGTLMGSNDTNDQYFIDRFGGDTRGVWGSAIANNAQAQAAGVGTGFFSMNRLQEDDLKLYRNGTLAASNLVDRSPYLTIDYEFYLMANNVLGTPLVFLNAYCGCFCAHQGLTAAESLAFYNAVQAYQTALGRAV